MVRKSVYGVFLIFVILISNGYAEEKEEVKEENTKNDDKTISKRGILHFGIHGHPHVHAHTHAVPIVPKIPVITKVPTIIKPIIPAVLPAPVIPTTPYHLTHGGAVVTSYNANYPRVPVFTKTVIPPAYPFLPAIPHHHHHGLVPHHHHHHGLFPHHHGHHHGIDLHHGFDHHHHHLTGLFPHHHHHHSLYPHHHHSAYPFDHHHHHNSFLPHHHHHSLLPHHHHHHADFPHVHVHKPIVPVAVPEIHHPKIPVFFPSKPVFSKPEFNPTFVPIPVPTNPQPNPTVITVNPGISSSSNHNNNHINVYPTTQQTPIQPFTNHHHDHHHQNSQGNWQPILKPTQPTVTENCITYNYHAALKSSSSTTSNNVPQTNNFISGQGPSMAQQLALYQQQQILHDQQSK